MRLRIPGPPSTSGSSQFSEPSVASHVVIMSLARYAGVSQLRGTRGETRTRHLLLPPEMGAPYPLGHRSPCATACSAPMHAHWRRVDATRCCHACLGLHAHVCGRNMIMARLELQSVVLRACTPLGRRASGSQSYRLFQRAHVSPQTGKPASRIQPYSSIPLDMRPGLPSAALLSRARFSARSCTLKLAHVCRHWKFICLPD